MATAISVANFQTAMGEAYDAVASSDYSSARSWLLRADIQLNGLALEVSNQGVVTELRKNLTALKQHLDKQEGQSGSQRHETWSRWVP